MASIQGVYLALFGRPADPLGLAFFNQATQNGANLTAIGDLSSTAEYQTRFTGQSNVQIINSIYRSLFNRDADLAGLTFFSNALATGALTINNIAIAIFDGAQGSDLTIRDLKVAAANSFTAAIDTAPEVLGYQGNAAAESGRQFISTVTTTAPSAEQVTAAVAAATQAGAGGGAGATFVLTAGADTADVAGSFRNGSNVPFDFKFSTGNEAVTASTATLTAGDVLSDASTTDTDVMNVAVTGATDLRSVTNIEKFVLTTNAAAGNIDFAAVTGAKEVTVSGAATSAITLANLTNTGITKVDGSGLTSAVNGLTADFSASATVVARTLTGGAAGDSLSGGAGDDVISGGGGADTLNGGAGADTLTGGAGGDTLNGGSGNDSLSGEAGDDALNGGLGNDTILGGAGVDTISSGGGTDKITGGAGNDVITLTTGVGNSETLIFEASSNGTDNITNFAGGTVAAGGDVLEVKAFTVTAATFAGTALAAGTVGIGDAGYTAAPGENVIVIETDAGVGNVDVNSDGALSLAELTSSTLKLGANAKAFVLYDNNVNTIGYNVTTDINGAFASIETVVTLVGVDASTLTTAQFA